MDNVNNPISTPEKVNDIKKTFLFCMWYGALFGSIVWQINSTGSSNHLIQPT